MVEGTMEEVVDEDSGLELNADEEHLVKFLRGKNVSAKHVSQRIEAHMSQSAPVSGPTSSVPTPAKEQTVTAPEVRKMLVEHGKKVEQTARAREVQGKIKDDIGKLVDDSGLTKKTRRRNRVVNEVFETLCEREDVAKLTDEDFQKVLVDETNKAIAEEREDDGAPSTLPPSNNEGRKTAAEAMGQTNGNEPPPRSAAQTEQPRGNRVNAGNVDEAFGAADRDWNISDGEIEQETSREAEKMLRKARGG